MKLLLIATVTFCLVVGQACKARGQDPDDQFPPLPDPGPWRSMANREFQAPQQQREKTNNIRNRNGLMRIQFIETMIDKFKEVAERFESMLQPIQELLEKNGFTNLSNALGSLMKAFDDFANSVKSRRNPSARQIQ